MSFPLNKRVNGVKVFNKDGTAALCKLDAVAIMRNKKDANNLTLAEPIGVTRVDKIGAGRLLPQLAQLSVNHLNQANNHPKYLKYIVVVDVRSCYFGKVGRVVGYFGKVANVDMLCDAACTALKEDQFRPIRNKDMLFDYNPMTQEMSDVYQVGDWDVGIPDRLKKHVGELVKVTHEPIGDNPITYKIQYVTSDGKVFGATWEANQYVDEQNKQRLHQKKMELLKTMAKEAGLEFEVNGSSIVLK